MKKKVRKSRTWHQNSPKVDSFKVKGGQKLSCWMKKKVRKSRTWHQNSPKGDSFKVKGGQKLSCQKNPKMAGMLENRVFKQTTRFKRGQLCSLKGTILKLKVDRKSVAG